MVVKDRPLHLSKPSTLPTSSLPQKKGYMEGHFCPLFCFLLSAPKAQFELQSNAIVHRVPISTSGNPFSNNTCSHQAIRPGAGGICGGRAPCLGCCHQALPQRDRLRGSCCCFFLSPLKEESLPSLRPDKLCLFEGARSD